MVSGGAGHHFSMSGISLVVKYASTGDLSLCAEAHTAIIIMAVIIIIFFIRLKICLSFIIV
jgi:hypothetical protein